MPKRKPAPPELIEAFETSVRALPDIALRKMFGFPAAFANGYMFAGLFEHSMVLKLPQAPREELLRMPGASRFEPDPGRFMGEFVVVPPALVKRRAQLIPWLQRACAYVRSLPPKTGKKSARR